MSILKTLFAPKEAKRPDAAALSRDHFADALLGALIASPHVDEALRQAGIHRHQLRRLWSDDEISAALETRRAAVLATPWRIDGYNESPPMQALSGMLTQHLNKILIVAWDAVPMGFSVFEVVWAQAGRTVTIQSLQLLPMEHFNPQTNGTLLATLPGLAYEQPVDNRFKFFDTVREQSHDDRHGRALLAPLYWPWHFRTHAWRYWMQFAERFGMPIVSGQVNSPAQFVEAMAGLGINTAIGVGPNEAVNMLSPSAGGEFEKLEAALCKRIQKLILGQTLTSDVGANGSFAAAKVHDLVRQDRRMSDLRLVVGTVQRVADAFWMLNGYGDKAPAILLEDGRNLEADRATRDVELVKAGAVNLTEQYLLTHYDFEPGDFTIPAAAPAAQPGNLSASAQFSPGRALAFTPGQQVIEDMTERAMRDAGAAIDAKAIRAAIEASESPEELAERLGELIPGATSAQFSAAIERALFAADVLGYGNADRRRF